MKAKLNFFSLLFLLVIGLSFLFPVYAQMGPGYAISFDGTDDVVLTGNPIITGTGDFTITAWIKRSSTGTVDYIAGNYGLGNGNGIEFDVLNTNKLSVYIAGSSISGTTDITAGTWHYVAVTRSGGTATLYLDGISEASGALGGNITGTRNFAIGNGPDYATEAFGGNIDEVRVFNAALTQDQIRLNEHLRLFVPFPGNLQAYWRFDEGTGVNAWESVLGGTYNGVLTNGPAWVTSTAPFGSGTSAKLTVPAGGSTYDASVQYTAYNATGSPVDFYVTLLTSSPASPPTVTRTYNKYWIFETYGVATGDANRIFSLPNGSISPTDLSTPGNIIVFYRDGTSDAAFLSAGATSTTQNTVTDHGTATSRQLVLGTNSNSPLTGPPHFSASDMNFGNVCVGFSHSIDLVITNDGTGWMYVSGVSANPSGFTYSTSTFNIAPGGTHNVTVTFSPSLVQLYNQSITFTYNGSTFVVNLQGRGIGAPTLSSPINGLTGVSILPTCTWGAVTGAASYKLYLDDNSGYASPNYNSNVGSVTSKTFLATDLNFPLINNTLYYWKVATVDDYGNELPSGSFHFTTVPDAGISLSMPTDASIVYTTSVIFSWWVGGSSTGLRYVLQYAQQGSTPSETQWAAAPSSITTNTYKTISGLLAGKKYYWRVIAQWNSGSHEVVCYSSVFSFNIQGGATVVPIPSWPIENAIVYTNSPTLSWYLGEYASGLTYEVDYVQDNGGSPGYSNAGGPNNYFTDYSSSENHISTGSSNLYYTIGPLTPGTKYWWKVRSYYAASGDYSAWSVVQSFRTNGTGTLTVPVPSYPTGAVTIYTTAPTFYWYLNTYATGLYYDVDLSTDPNFGTSVAGYPHTTAADQLYYNVSGLTPGQTYYWRVRSNNLTNQSAWSESIPITNATFNVVGGSTNSYPILTYPILNTVVYTPTPTLSWYLEGSSLGLTGYTLKYTNNSTGQPWSSGTWETFSPGAPSATQGQATVSPTSTTYYTLPVSLNYGDHYYWAVRTNGTTPSAFSQSDFTVVGSSTVGSPILFLPINGSTIYSTTVYLYWYMNGSTTGIDYYNIQYSNSDVFASPTSTTSATQSLAVSGLTSGATYYWKVQAHYTTGSPSPWSAVWSFTIQVGSPKVVQPIVGGPDNVQINTSYATLSWFTPMQAPSAMKYEVDYADNPDFSNAKQVSDIAATHIQVNELNSNTQYYWRVKSKADDGTYSYYSNTGSFKVGDKATAVGNESVIPKEFSVSQNYPNPFNPITVINYALPKSTFVSIKIYNMLGQEVKTLVNSEKSAGTYSVQWGGDNNYGQQVSSGTYIYRVVAGEYSRTLKMTLVK